MAASTATGHLNLLVAGGLLAQERQGRHRYVRLADAGTAELIERLASMAKPATPQPGSLSVVSRHQALARARTCYDHLAGTLGVAITEAMTLRGLLDWEQGPALTSEGSSWFAALGITLPGAARRPLVRSCLDWTERRPHLAGTAGAALCSHALASGWITRIGSGRAVIAHRRGPERVPEHLGLAAGVALNGA